MEAVLKGEFHTHETQAAERLTVKFVEWFKKQDMKVVSIEEHLKSSKFKYHGTFDFVAEVGGVLTMCDLKTSNAIYDDMALQLAGYQIAWNEVKPAEQLNQGLIIRLDKKTEKVYTKSFKNLDQYREVFLGLRTAWSFVNKEGAFKCLRKSKI